MEKTKEDIKRFAALHAYCIFLFCYCNAILLYMFAIQTSKVWMFLMSLAMGSVGVIVSIIFFMAKTREPKPKYQYGYPQQYPQQQMPQVPETLPEPPEVVEEEQEPQELPDLTAQFQDMMQEFIKNSQKQMAKMAEQGKQKKKPVTKPAKKIPTFKVEPKFAAKTAPKQELDDDELEDN